MQRMRLSLYPPSTPPILTPTTPSPTKPILTVVYFFRACFSESVELGNVALVLISLCFFLYDFSLRFSLLDALFCLHFGLSFPMVWFEQRLKEVVRNTVDKPVQMVMS